MPLAVRVEFQERDRQHRMAQNIEVRVTRCGSTTKMKVDLLSADAPFRPCRVTSTGCNGSIGSLVVLPGKFVYVFAGQVIIVVESKNTGIGQPGRLVVQVEPSLGRMYVRDGDRLYGHAPRLRLGSGAAVRFGLPLSWSGPAQPSPLQ